MSSFTGFDTKLNLTYLGFEGEKRDSWRVEVPFTYYLKDKPTTTVTVPKGFVTDGATIPWPLSLLIPAFGPHGQAAVLHDYMLEVGQMRAAGGRFVYCKTREEAREHFIDALEVLDVPYLSRLVLSVGVWIWDQFKPNKLR